MAANTGNTKKKGLTGVEKACVYGFHVVAAVWAIGSIMGAVADGTATAGKVLAYIFLTPLVVWGVSFAVIVLKSEIGSKLGGAKKAKR